MWQAFGLLERTGVLSQKALWVGVPHTVQARHPVTVIVFMCYARPQNCQRRLIASSCLSVRPYGTTRLPLHGFLRKFIFEYFSKICRKDSSFTKIWQNNRHCTGRPTYIIISSQIRLRMRGISHSKTKAVEKIKSHILCSIIVSLKIIPFMR